jgi:radical SAM protein with 4Fe4S-binding SPASM domain
MLQSMRFLRRGVRFVIRYVTSYYDPKRFVPPEIPDLSIETTNICNSKCVFCANPVMNREKEPLSMELFKKSVDEFVAMGGTQICFNVTIGDPLLDRQLLERARYVKSKPELKDNGFITTLQWLHLFDLDEFFDARFTWISVSTVLSGKQSYIDFFKVDKYDQMLKNLVLLLNENKKRGNPMHVGVDIKPTDESVEQIINHPDYQLIKQLTGYDLDERVRSRSFHVDDWIGAVKLPAYLKKRPLIPRPYRPCQLLYKGLMVYSNGNVGACSCRDFDANSDLILGNVKDRSLQDLWNGEKLASLRSNWLAKNEVPNICQSCRHYLY